MMSKKPSGWRIKVGFEPTWPVIGASALTRLITASAINLSATRNAPDDQQDSTP